MAPVVIESEGQSSNQEPADASSIKLTRTAAKRAFKSGDWQLAIENANALLACENVGRGMAIEILSRSYCELSELEKATPYLEELLTITTKKRVRDYADAKLGACYIEAGEFELAEKHLQRALGTKADGLASYNLACLRCRQGDNQQALDYLERAAKKRDDLREKALEDEDFESLRRYVRFLEVCREKTGWLEAIVVRAVSLLIWSATIPLALVVLAFQLFGPGSLRRMAAKLSTIPLQLLKSDQTDVCGVKVAKVYSDETSIDDSCYKQLEKALRLIERCAPRRFKRIQQDLKWILILHTDVKGALVGTDTCLLNASLFEEHLAGEGYMERAVEKIASVIVHEACHARLSARNIQQSRGSNLVHVERICRRQQALFAKKVASQRSENDGRLTHDVDFATGFGCYESWLYGNRQLVSNLLRGFNLWSDDGMEVVSKAWRAYVWSEQSRFLQFCEDLTENLSSTSRDPEAWYTRSESWGQLRQYDRAVADLQRSLELDPNVCAVWQWLGQRAFDHGDVRMAFDAYQRALELEPANRDSLEWLSYLAAKLDEHKPKAIDYAESMIAATKYHHDPWICLGLAYMRNERYEEGLREVKQVLEYHPTCGRGLHLAIVILRKLERYDEADTYRIRYVEAREEAIAKYSQPRYVEAIPFYCRRIDYGFDTRLLFSIDKLVTRDLTKLAESLLDQTHATPNSLVEKYLHSMIRSSAFENDPFPLPTSVTNRRHMFLKDEILPLHDFDDGGPPKRLQPIRICVDRKDPEWLTCLGQPA